MCMKESGQKLSGVGIEMYRVFHYRKKCIGCNACVEADKNRWRMSRKDGKSIFIGGKNAKEIYIGEFENEEFYTIMKAVKICSVKIIRIEKLK